VNILNKKELIKLIKEKAEQVEVKDFTESIIMKTQSFKPAQIEKTRPYIALKPILTMTILVFALLFVSILAIPYLPEKPLEFDGFNEAIAISSLAAINLANQTYTPLTTETLSYYEGSAYIDDEISQLTSYLMLVEQIVLSNKLITSETQIDRYRRLLSFDTNNLLNESQNYQLSMTYLYESRRQDLFSIGGVIVSQDEVYNIEAVSSINNGQHELTLTLKIDLNNFITVKYYQDGQQHIYDVSLYVRNQLTKNLALIHRQNNDQQELFVHFIKGNTQGSYRFTQNDTELNAHYAILRNGSRETGQMKIEVFDHPMSNLMMYRFHIQPLGDVPFIAERNRSNHPNLNRMVLESEQF
jgi:hypothetical protein